MGQVALEMAETPGSTEEKDPHRPYIVKSCLGTMPYLLQLCCGFRILPRTQFLHWVRPLPFGGHRGPLQ